MNPNKKRTRRRYETPGQIYADVDKWKAKASALREAAQAQDLKADMLFKAGPEMKSHAEYARSMAAKKRRSALRIETRKLVLLKQKLAELQTMPLPLDGVDKSIQAT